MPVQIAVSVDSIGDEEALQQLVGERAEIRVVDLSTPERVAEATASAAAVVVALQPMSADRIAAFGDSVEVIGRAGVGLDTVDLDAAAARAVTVVHEPGYSTGEVADHAAALLLACTRQVAAGDRAMRADGWVMADRLGRMPDLGAATLGVLGIGRIGSALIARMRPFVRRIVAFDPAPAQVPDGVELLDSLDDVLRAADLVSLHLPLTDATRGLIGERELALARDGAVLVNVARGALVDESALVAALAAGQLAGAGLDAFVGEPLGADSPLLTLPNVVLTPHLGGHSEGAAARLASWMLDDVIAHLQRRELPHGRYAAGPFVRA
ncbi:NAD(P)-dependent oxidoreductase [Conexibacter sp. CPCC 206217]|uniref:NAD(P)-dependent oxidoreductase n=1 Tax=Conexibacter sp. CPCC 206217 TaxID=3064574 RepID=UPI0027279321|nr:NAD(P)-dependent oxidoreductase [Conexibacter sp. CPCC 206217]MDO8210329.1 NAD(P)-dependent oxidoreductase [Conexibacter sp. CPCC 206217]